MKFVVLTISLFLTSLYCKAQIDTTSTKIKVMAIRKDFYDKLPHQISIFCDFTHSLASSQVAIMDSLWSKFYQSSQKGIATAILDSGRISRNDFNEFAETMYQSWYMNDEANALYIIASPELKRVRMFLGKGLAKYLSAEDIDQISSKFILPKFENKNFFDGIKSGTEEVIRRIKLNGG